MPLSVRRHRCRRLQICQLSDSARARTAVAWSVCVKSAHTAWLPIDGSYRSLSVTQFDWSLSLPALVILGGLAVRAPLDVVIVGHLLVAAAARPANL